MHYKNGREAKIGDRILFKDSTGAIYGGVLVEANAGADTCNGKMLPSAIAQRDGQYVTLGDCLHADDVTI